MLTSIPRRHRRFEAEMKALVIVDSGDVWRPLTFWTVAAGSDLTHTPPTNGPI